ncbi:imelysin family protein [Marivirga tractuosa]|uniref:imelysin family protein n=1 Tax=Marivirga tractuosa TaxID=1006 RepID=UPI0035D0AC26
MQNIKIIVFLSFIILSACTNTDRNTDFDKKPMLENIAKNLAIPAYESSLKSFISLDSSISLLKQENEDNLLKNVRELWKNASITWAETIPYHFGPIDELLIENNFHYFPIDTSILNKSLLQFNGEDDFINQIGSNSRGLAAIEYLLFSKKTGLDSTKISFAKMISRNLVNLNEELLNHWTSNYAKSFIRKPGNDINASMTLLSNQWIETVEKIKNVKVGMPSGIIAEEDKNLIAIESPYANISLSLIQANLRAMQKSFNGGEGKGVDDYLNALDIKDDEGKLLSFKINSQFDLLIELTDHEKHNLINLIQEDSEKLDQIYLEVINLSILFKTDLMGQLGLITTFSDSDGD